MVKPKIGLDVDGVIADFTGAFYNISWALFGKPGPGYVQKAWAFEDSGLTPAQVEKVWKEIKRTTDFWLGLRRLPHTEDLCGAERRASLFFITSRVATRGMPVVHQTELWLRRNFGLEAPYVTVVHKASDKLDAIKDLGLLAYIDDKQETYTELGELLGHKLRVFRCARSYNKHVEGVEDVESLNAFLREVDQ